MWWCAVSRMTWTSHGSTDASLPGALANTQGELELEAGCRILERRAEPLAQPPDAVAHRLGMDPEAACRRGSRAALLEPGQQGGFEPRVAEGGRAPGPRAPRPVRHRTRAGARRDDRPPTAHLSRGGAARP